MGVAAVPDTDLAEMMAIERLSPRPKVLWLQLAKQKVGLLRYDLVLRDNRWVIAGSTTAGGSAVIPLQDVRTRYFEPPQTIRGLIEAELAAEDPRDFTLLLPSGLSQRFTNYQLEEQMVVQYTGAMVTAAVQLSAAVGIVFATSEPSVAEPETAETADEPTGDDVVSQIDAELSHPRPRQLWAQDVSGRWYQLQSYRRMGFSLLGVTVMGVTVNLDIDRIRQLDFVEHES